jgi:hypothetical protein
MNPRTPSEGMWLTDCEVSEGYLEQGSSSEGGPTYSAEPRLRIGFQITAKPVYRVQAGREEV